MTFGAFRGESGRLGMLLKVSRMRWTCQAASVTQWGAPVQTVGSEGPKDVVCCRPKRVGMVAAVRVGKDGILQGVLCDWK